jgi:5'(3')-deoxyribonucleotidase
MTEQTPERPVLYLDMDGVLADFNRAARDLLGARPSEELAAGQQGRWPDEQWQQIRRHQDFYRHLPKTARADEFIALSQKFRTELDYDIRILTAIPRNNDMPRAFHDKILWVQEHWPELDLAVYFGPYSEDKHRHCLARDYILVDDRTSNCESWRRAGGIAVQVRPGQDQQALEELQGWFHTLTTLQWV